MYKDTPCTKNNMPSRNIIKHYTENGYYHIYNRGVNKEPIFLEKKDCVVFQRFLKQYLSPKDQLAQFIGSDIRVSRLINTNMSDKIEILAFSLMPNHFHLLLRQTEMYAIATFMKRLFTSYVKYFNKKYKRIGPLFQDTYKGLLVENDNYVLHLSRYIHLNPRNLKKDAIDYNEFCSYPYYLGEKEGMWVHPEFILSYFPGTLDEKRRAYKKFVETFKQSPFTKEQLEELLLNY